MTERARRWFVDYFGPTTASRAVLPQALDLWLRWLDAPSVTAERVPALRTPFIVERDGKRLVVRLLGEGERRLLPLDEEQRRFSRRSSRRSA